MSCAALALAAVASTASAAEKADHGPQSKHDEVRIGALASTGFPRPLGFEAMLKIGDYVAIGAEYSTLPTMTVSGVDVSLRAYGADLRIFPFGNPFFIGARMGRQHGSTEASVTYMSRTYSGSETVDTTFLNPRVGFLWTSKWGLTVGMDAGVQVPLSHTTSFSVPAGITVPTSLTTPSDTLGAHVIPTVTLLQLGLLL